MHGKSKKILSVAAIFVIASTMVIGAFSYFTDYASETKSATAGSFGIELEHEIDIDGAVGILNPGDVYSFDFTVKNTKQKAADVYAVVTVTGTPYHVTTYEDENSKRGEEIITNTASPYKLLENGSTACFADSAEMERDSTSTNRTYVYVLPVKELSGTVETIDGKGTEVTYEYEFGMDIDTMNDWVMSTVDVKIEIYAKQHENTADISQTDWKSAVEAQLETPAEIMGWAESWTNY